MDLTTVADNVTKIQADDSTIYLFGSELYCGWCLESFTCPVRLKIHCHVEHFTTCSCGERYRDKETLCKHIARSTCHLPSPFKWSHFVKLPSSEVSEVCSSNTVEDNMLLHSLDEDETTDENTSSKSGVLAEGTHQINVTIKRKMLPIKKKQKGNKESSLQTFQQQKLCCGLCPFQCKYKSDFERHMQRKHREDAEQSISVNSCHGLSMIKEDCIAVENDAVTGTISEALYKHDVNLESTVAEKAGHVNPFMTVSDVSQKIYCKKLRNNDMPFIASCFSSSLDGKLFCCDLCSDEFGEWKDAAMHVYNSHLSALKQWHDTHVDNSNKPQLSEISSDKKSSDNDAGDQLKKLHSAEECEVDKSDNIVCDGDNRDMQLNITELSSVNSEFTNRDISTEPSTIPLEENKMKHIFTTDQCNIIASSLVKLFSCWNFEPKAEIPNGKTLDTHSSSAVPAITVPVLSKKLPSASNTKPVKAASGDMVVATKLISRKCKFCHRVCSTRWNCKRHEAICYSVLSKSKSGIETVRKIRGSNIFYCSRCGFSDSDQHVVNEHVMEPHTVSNTRLHVKPVPGHDYVGSMKLATGSFQCTLCGVHKPSRSKMLMHLHRHSSLAALPKGVHTSHPESTAMKMKEGTKQQSSQFPFNTCARSCPQCFRSFSSVAKYLSHRAVCRAVHHRQRSEYHGSVCKYSYLFRFCKQTSDGRWKCKLCEHCSRHRKDLYKHIRDKHNQMQNTKLEAQCFSKELSQKTANGWWQCKLCKHCSAHRCSVYKHIRAKHSSELNKNQEIAKLNDISGFCEPVTDGRFQCTLCKCLRNNRSNLLGHIRAVHFKMVLPATKKLSASPSFSTVTFSSSSVGKHTVESTVLLSSQPKSQSMHFVKPCPNCRRVFMRKSSYQNHVKWCCKHDHFMERISTGRVKCRLCHFKYRNRSHCLRHLRQKHRLTDESVFGTHNNVGTYVTEHTKSYSAVTESPSSVGKHPVESSALHKSHTMHFVKPCPNCKRVFTRNTSYQNHVKWCGKRDCFVERISSRRVKCRICHSTYSKHSHCIKHLHQKHLLTDESIYSTCNNAGTYVTEHTESYSAVAVSSPSVRRHTVKSTAVLSSLHKSHTMHFVKLCPKCRRVFTRRTSYQNHVKWCGKRDRFVERISFGRVKCRLCHSTYSKHGHCLRHLRQKHLLTDESIYSTHDDAGTYVTEHTESHSAVAVPSPSVGKHTVESTAVLSSLHKSEPMHLVIPCPNCRRVFRRSGYQNHVKWCGKRDRFVERISSGRVKCRLCHSTYSQHRDCIKHVRQKHLLTDKSLCSTNDNSVTNVTEHTETCSADTVSSPSVGQHTVESTSLLSALHKSQSMHFVKPCPSCRRVFTRRSSYQNHVKWCGKRHRFMERISSGRVKCRLCHSTYRQRSHCLRHLRQKHLLTDESTYSTHDNSRTCLTEHTQTCLADTVSSASVAQHTVESTSLLSALHKSQSMHFVKPCPSCKRVFTRRSSYQTHVKLCGKRDLFVEKLSSGRVRCCLCHSTYSKRSHCLRHLRLKHILTDESAYNTHDNSGRCLTERTQTCSADTVSSSSVGKHTGESNALLQKSLSVSFVKTCPNCRRTFTKSGYQNHVKRCGKRDRLVERISSGRVRCRLCHSTYGQHSDCIKHIRQKHLLSDRSVCSTNDNSVTYVTEHTETCSADTAASPSVGKHTVESTSLLSALHKSQSMHFVKPCPSCKRVFTRRSSYQNHVKWCGKRDLLVERISSGRVRCRLCHSTYGQHGNCIKHVRQKHLLSDKSVCRTNDNSVTNVTEHTETCSADTAASPSVGQHTVESTSLLSALHKSQSMHFVKPCPSCKRVFTRRSSYQNHVKWCGKRDRAVERILSN